MNTKKIDNLKSLFILMIIIYLIHFISTVPWWAFSIPVFIAGIIIEYRGWQVSFFGTGFLAGFLIWASTNFYFDWTYPGDLLTNVAKLLFLPKIALILISGIIGGMISGLAFYSGKNIWTTNVNKGLL